MKCPDDKILVVYSVRKDGKPDPTDIWCYNKSALVSPFKKHAFLDLTPFEFNFDLKNMTTKDGYHLKLCGTVTYGISDDAALLPVAADRLLLLTRDNIAELARDVITGTIRIAVGTLTIEELQFRRDKALGAIVQSVEKDLNMLGLKTIKTHITDIDDGEGYIAAYWQQQIEKALEKTKKDIEKAKTPEKGENKN